MATTATELRILTIAGNLLPVAAREVDDLHRARLYKLAGLLLELAAFDCLEGFIDADSETVARAREDFEDGYAFGSIPLELANDFEDVVRWLQGIDWVIAGGAEGPVPAAEGREE